MEEMASYLRSYFRNVNSHCFDDSQWKIGAFLTNSFANKKKFRSRKKKIHFGLNQQPDCVVILNADRKSSVILEADRSQIPIASLGDSTIPWESYKRITYTIPSRDSIEFSYFFCHSIMKTVIIEQNSMKVEKKSLGVTLSTGASRAPYSSIAHSRGKKVSPVRLHPNRIFRRYFGPELFEVIAPFVNQAAESLPQPQGGAAPVVQDTPAPQGGAAPVVLQDTPQGFTALQPIPGLPGENVQSMANFMADVLRANLNNNNNIYPISGLHNPVLENSGGAGPSTSNPPMDFSPTMSGTLSKEKIYFNLLHLDAFRQTSKLSPDQLMDLTDQIYALKASILAELTRSAGPVNCDILWNTDGAGDAIRNREGEEFDIKALRTILKNLKENKELSECKYLKGIWKRRMETIPKANLQFLRAEDLPGDIPDSLTRRIGSDWEKCDLMNQKNLWNPGAGNDRFS